MKLPFKFKSADEAYRKIAITVNNLDDGHISATDTFTITASTTTTTVTNTLCHSATVVVLMPKTANAATELATLHIAPAKGQYVITHANNAQTDRDFSACLFG